MTDQMVASGAPRAKVTSKKFDSLLEAARAAANPTEAMAAEDAVLKALLELTVYAHVPAEPGPPDRIRFIQFIRPDDGQTVLPFFSDREQAEEVAARTVGVVAMTGRRLLEPTRGATLMLDPNMDYVALYPPEVPEVSAVLDGRPWAITPTRPSSKQSEPGAARRQVPRTPWCWRSKGCSRASPRFGLRTWSSCIVARTCRTSP
jgi:hypothetical protein